MKLYFFVIVLCFFGCYQNNINETEENIICLHVDGLTICQQETEYSKDVLSKLIKTTNDSVNKYYPGLDLPLLMDDAQLTVNLYPYERLKVGGVYLRGNQTISLSIPDSSWPPQRQCLQKYYTLGHELLHFIDYYYLGNTSNEHNTEYLFFLGSEQYEQTAEYDIWITFSLVCGYDPSLTN